MKGILNCHCEPRQGRGNLIQISRANRLRSPRRCAPRDDIKGSHFHSNDTIGSYFHSNDTKGDFSFIMACVTGDNCKPREGRGNLYVFLRFESNDRHVAALLAMTHTIASSDRQGLGAGDDLKERLSTLSALGKSCV